VTNNLNQHVFQKQNFSTKEGAVRAKKVRWRFLDGTSHSSVGWNKKISFDAQPREHLSLPFDAFEKHRNAFLLNGKYAATFFQVRNGSLVFFLMIQKWKQLSTDIFIGWLIFH
jgi:hypothetical protein